MKTKEQVKTYNKEYFSRPEVIARAKIRNSKYRLRRRLYKKTVVGRINENKYRKGSYLKVGQIRRLQRYGVSPEEFDVMIKRQQGKCAICLKIDNKLHIDHCHTTGRVRGLLCGNCNRALGLLKDNTTFLAKAIEYLNN